MSERAVSEDQPPHKKVADGLQTNLQPLYNKPWRVLQHVTLKDLKVTLANYKPVQLKKDPVSAINVLLVGPVGSGKSSFVNTVNSAFEGRVAFRCCAGSTGTGQSVTSRCQGYVVYNPASGHPMKFRLCDTRGLDDSTALDINSFTRGCAEAGLTFGQLVHRQSYSEPAMYEKVHCLVIVLDSCTLDTTSEPMWKKIKSILSSARRFGLPQAVLLTKVDQLDLRVGADVSLVFRSPAMEDAVSKAAILVGVPRNHVLPVKNYESEGSLVPEMDKLALLSLRSMLHHADDFLFNFPHEPPPVVEAASPGD